jgi:hypothetical protein
VILNRCEINIYCDEKDDSIYEILPNSDLSHPFINKNLIKKVDISVDQWTWANKSLKEYKKVQEFLKNKYESTET